MSTIVMDNPASVAAAGKAAVRIRRFYQLEELYANLCSATEALTALYPEIATQTLTVEFSESAVEDREEDLLVAAIGKSETERKANHVQAKRSDEQLKTLRQQLVFDKTKLAQLMAQREAAEANVANYKTIAALTAAELSAIGAAATLEVANG